MSYKGLCVGGIRAGEWISNDSKAWSVRDFNGRAGRFHGPVLVHWSIESLADGTAGYSTDYVLAKGRGGLDFWVPEGKDWNWAVQELIRAYRLENLPSFPNFEHLDE